jgi:Protein of unknown function (DUF4235)
MTKTHESDTAESSKRGDAGSTVLKLVYKPLGLLAGAAGGVLAGALFKRVWRMTSGEEEAPSATDPEHSWKETIVAAVLAGAVFGGVKAVVDRAGAAGFARATGTWPG